MTEYTAQQIVDFLKAGGGPDSLFESSRLAQQLAAKHIEARDMMTRLQSAMSEAWSGNAAAQAQAGAGPLLAASEVSAVHLAAAQNSLMTQGSDYADLRNKVGDGPGPQPQEDFLSRHLPMLTHKDEEIAGWNAKAQEVVQHYGTYNGQSLDNTAGLPRDYGELTLPSGGADLAHAEKPHAERPAVVTPPGGRDRRRTGTGRTTPVEHRGTGQDTSWGQERPGGDTATGTTVAGEVASSQQQQQQQPGTDVVTAEEQRPGGTTVAGQDDGTQTSGLAPVAHAGSAHGMTPPGLIDHGFGRDGGSGDITGRLGPSVPAIDGTDGRNGPDGTGRTGRAGRTEREPGSTRGRAGNEPGGRSGAGRLGERGVARPGAAGVSGKPGAGGIGGPMGRGGQKEEDKEHKRLDILQEPDPDELFGGFPDGMKPVAPTIGV